MALGQRVLRGFRNAFAVTAGIAIAAIVTPLVILIRLFILAFGLESDRTPQDVIDNLEGILAGDDSDGHWDDLDSVPIKEPRLEAIRIEALGIQTPLNETGRTKLNELLARAKKL